MASRPAISVRVVGISSASAPSCSGVSESAALVKPADADAASSAAASPWISARHLPRQALLTGALLRRPGVLGGDGVDVLDRNERELQQVALDIGVGQVDEVLIERVGRRARGIEEQRPVDALAELLAVRARDEGHRQTVDGRAGTPAHEVDAGRDVAPLIRAARLQLAVQVLVQPRVVVGLQQHVAELRERDAVLARDAAPDRLLGEHVVDRDVLADVAQEVEHAQRLGPVAVVHEARLARPRLEVEERRELCLDRLRVAAERLAVEQVALLAATARVADHPRGPARERDREVAGELEAAQEQQRDEVARCAGCRRSDRSRRRAPSAPGRDARAVRPGRCDPGAARARAGRR